MTTRTHANIGLWLVFFLILRVEPVSAVAPVAVPFTIGSEERPKIDGNLDEVVWDEAVRIKNFHQVRPEDHGEATQKTEVQIARDENNIYVAFRVYDTEIEKLGAKGLIQGQSFFSDDRVAITIDTFNDRRNSYFFQVNPNGIRREALLGNDYFIDEWDAVWYAESRIYDWGWVGEMAIPLKSISFDPTQSTWGVNFTRVSPGRGEEMAWSSIDRNTDPSAFGSINNMQGFTQGRGIQLSPSVSAAYTDSSEDGSNSSLEPAITAFYNVTPNLTAGITLNTDFSGTEVDDRQLNLGRFSLFFPEKRDFFLRDASIFEFGGIDGNANPFFSRRIGLSDDGEPLDINAGVKLTGRAGNWNVGALAINQDVLEPNADESLFVGRLTRNVGKESKIGLVTTVGDPLADTDNKLFGVDYNYSDSQFLGDKRLRANVWYQESDSNEFDANQRAYGVQLNYPNYKYSSYFEFKRIEENFNPALGFVNRQGVTQGYGQTRYRHAMDDSFWQWLGTRVQYFRADRIGGGIQSEEATLNILEGFSKSNDFFTLFLNDETEGVDESFDLLDEITVPAGIYRGTRYGLFVETGRQRPIRFEFELSDGDFFGGSRTSVSPTIEWRPSKHFFASVSARQSDIDLPNGSIKSKLYAARANVAFNSKWAWLNIIQGDNISDTVSINSRLRYQPKADREFFLVFNQTRDTETDETTDTTVILKAAFNFQL